MVPDPALRAGSVPAAEATQDGGVLHRLTARRDLLGLMLLTLAAKPLGFLVQLLIASSFGARNETDAYFVSLFLTSFVANIGVQVFTTLFIPLYFDHTAQAGERQTIAFLNAALAIFSVPLLVFSLVLIAAPRLAIAIAAPGFTGETLLLAERMTRIMGLGTLLAGIGGYLSALLNVRRVFLLPGATPLLQAATTALGIWLLREPFGALALPLAFLAAAIVKVLVQIPAAARLGLLRFVAPAWRDPLLARMRTLAGPVLVSALIVQALFMIDKVLGSLLDAGSVSALGYATTVNMLILQLFAGTLVTVMFTDLAALAARGDAAAFRAAFGRDARYLLALIVPFAVLVATKSRDIIEILYERGRFDAAATDATSRALVMYAIGLPMLGMNMLLGRVFHSLKEMQARMWIDIAWLASSVAASFALIRPLGVAGLALGTSLASAVNVVLALMYLRRRRRGSGEGEALRAFAQSGAAGAVMAAAILWTPLGALGEGAESRFARAVGLAEVALIGGLAYLGAWYALGRLFGRAKRT